MLTNRTGTRRTRIEWQIKYYDRQVLRDDENMNEANRANCKLLLHRFRAQLDELDEAEAAAAAPKVTV